MSLLDLAIVKTLPLVPRSVVRLVAGRYIAGEELADARRVVSALNAEGKLATLDVLGEEVTSRDEAAELTRAYLGVLEAIEAAGLDANVSVKPTALGLELGRDVFRENLETVVRAAARHGNFVRIDMEDSSTTDATLATYRELREAGHANVGVVLQSELRRTVDDARALADLRPSVRVCKGIYLEPEEIAYRDAGEIRRSFVETVDVLLGAGAYVALATHDEPLLAECLHLVGERGLSPDDYEIQFLLGVKSGIATRLVRDGHRLRVYVPFGPRWYEYSTRRLRENPRMATTVALALLRRPATRR
jgi:proline dehydrogenase